MACIHYCSRAVGECDQAEYASRWEGYFHSPLTVLLRFHIEIDFMSLCLLFSMFSIRC